MTSDIFKPGDGCVLRTYEGNDYRIALETFNSFQASMILGETTDSSIGFKYTPKKVTMISECKEDGTTHYIIKVEGVLV